MVQEESLESFRARLFKIFNLDSYGVLTFKENRHSKQRKGDSPKNINGGYLKVTIDRKSFLVHRLVFLMHYGYLPECIDHIDRNKLNNRPDNLRAADKKLNSWNRSKQKNNTSGSRGVSWNKSAGKWHAYIKVEGKRRHLGLFDCKEEARIRYEQELHEIGRYEEVVKGTTEELV